MKRLMYAAILIVLVGIIFKVYTGLNGSPLKKAQAERDMKSYIEQNYPGKSFILGEVFYSMSFGAYTAQVTSKDDSSISFHLNWRSGSKVFYDEYVYKYAKDEAMSKKFSDQITEKLGSILKDQITGFTDVSSELYIKKGDYDSGDNFNKTMPENITVWVYMFGERIPKDEFVERCIKARDLISKEGYKVETYSFHYGTGFEGDVKGGGEELYSLALRGDLLGASGEEILKSREFYENTGKGRMIFGAILYKGVITLFVLGILGIGVAIALKERKNSKRSRLGS